MIWDEQHIKALLRLPRYPKQLLSDEPWAGWLRERHGASAVRESLRQAPLNPIQNQLLEMVLSDPSTPPFRRAALLHVSQSTYFRYLDALVAALMEYLNAPEQGDLLLDYPTTNLPAPLTPLIGAETTLQQVAALLARPQVRLVTLMGTGGIGKTRLAIQAARHILESEERRRAFDDGIFWVDLAPLRAPDLILVEIARVLNLTERNRYPTLELLQRELHERKVLLLLDNFEHLLAAAPLVAQLLRGTTRLKILVTSRAALDISGEHRLSIPLLGLPGFDPLPAFQRLSDYSAIQLFVQRAQEIDGTFALTPDNALAVAQLCAAFEGLPLALELAARRLSHLSLQQMLSMLGQRLQLLAGGARDAAPRHQTLRNLIDWSDQLLEAYQQTAFQRLAVFANGWTLEAMEAVCADVQPPVFDILASLINQSIVFRQSNDPTPRFGMLETIREYAQEKLAASGEEEITRKRHADYYRSLVQAWTEPNVTPSLPVEDLESEYHNLRIALQWAIEQSQSELALDLAIAIWHYWTTVGSPSEGQYWLARVLAIKPPLRGPKRIYVLTVMAQVTLYYQSDFQQAYAYYDEIVALAQELNSRYDLGVALQGLGDIAQFDGDYRRARALYLESLALYRGMDNTYGVGWALDRLGNVALEQGFVQEALSFYTESLSIFESLDSEPGITHARAKLGLIALEKQDYADAAKLFENTLSHLRPTDSNWHYAWLIEYLGQAVLGLGDIPRAAEFFRQSLKVHFEGKAYRVVAYNLNGLANVALAQGQSQRAVRLLSAVQLLYEKYAPIPSRRRQLEVSVAHGRDVLTPAAFEAAWGEGQAMSLDQVVAEGLEIPN